MNRILLSLAFVLLSQLSHAGPEQAPLVVWANEAAVATYSFSYKNFLPDQKQIAKYFTSEGWMAYSKALTDSKLPESVQKNQYVVSAVPTLPPVITAIDSTHWKAVMNLLVVYENPQYQQHQNLKVTINFGVAPEGQGVRGYSISSLQAVTSKPPCKCPVEKEEAIPANLGNAK